MVIFSDPQKVDLQDIKQHLALNTFGGGEE